MTEPRDPAARVRRFLADRAPHWMRGDLHDDLDLTADLGFDSVALVELLLACEDAFGVPCPPALFDEARLTVGRLVAHIEASSAAR